MRPVLDYLKKNQPRFLRELCDYVRFPSVSAQPHHKQDLIACARWIHEQCQQIGLQSRLCSTAGNPVILARTPGPRNASRPHYVIYGHYDVQPAEPFDLWRTPPFKPVIRGKVLCGRGASDNKGQHFAHLKAVEALLRVEKSLPCDLTFLIEGEEEVGSSSLGSFIQSHRAELLCDAVIISDSGMPSLRHPALTYALRGILAFELEVTGPSRDLHSGIYGGSVENPAMALSQLLAGLRDRNGRINVPGFYDDVTPLSAYERKQLARMPHDDEQYRKFLGVPQLSGERGYTTTERRSARPTLEINGLTSGYQGVGSKTIVPAWARAKITCRLVPDQDPERIQKLLTAHLKRTCPKTVRLKVESGHGGDPYLVSPKSPHAQAALKALRAAFGLEPVLIREGGSIPIVNKFKQHLGVDTLLLGLALPDDNPHSPNEKFSLRCFEMGMRLGVHLWPELARVPAPAK